MNRILGVDRAAQSISGSVPEAARIIGDKLPLAAEKLTANAPESLSAGAKALTANLPEALSQAARSLGGNELLWSHSFPSESLQNFFS